MTRRRGPELEEALLQAAWDELVENGYASFTMDAVADRARTSRPVLYRRWPDRRELVRAATRYAIEREPVEVPDTGTLRDDVLELMRRANSARVPFATTLAVHLAGYYQETGTSPADLKALVARGRRNALDEIYRRAADRGEIDLDRLPARLRSLPFDLLRHDFLMTFSPVPDADLVEIVDTLFMPLVRQAQAAPGTPETSETSET